MYNNYYLSAFAPVWQQILPAVEGSPHWLSAAAPGSLHSLAVVALIDHHTCHLVKRA